MSNHGSEGGAVDQDEDNKEKLTRLCKSRGGHIANVKKKFKDFQDCSKHDLEVVRESLASLETAVSKYQDVHAQCVCLASQVDKGKLPKFEADLKEIDDALQEARHQYSELVAMSKDDVAPNDSASQCNTNVSAHSLASSTRAKTAAKRAALQVKSKFLKQQQALEQNQLRLKTHMDEELLRQKAEMECLQLQTEIEVAIAEEEALDKYMGSPVYHTVVQPVMGDQSSPCFHATAIKSTESDNGEEQSSPDQPEAEAAVQKPEIGCTKGSGIQSSNLNRLAEPWRNLSETESAFLTLQRQMLDVMNLPKTTLMSFDGNPINYWAFINSFDSCVGNSSVSDGAKLNRLFEYCKGKAAHVIKPCAMMNPSEGYAKARVLLKERFGNEFTISQAWVDKVCEGPALKANNAEALQDFSDDVRGCMETLKAINKLSEIDSRVRMVKVMERLPFYLQSRWRKEAVKTMDITGDYPNIDRLAKFLSTAAKEANDPVFGSLNTKFRDYKISGKSGNTKPGAAFNVHAEDRTMQTQSSASSKGRQFGAPKTNSQAVKPCHHCGGNHRLPACEEFKKMSPQNRMELVKCKRLCFNCLLASNHVARWCRKGSDCGKQGCTKRHSTLLHDAMQFAINESVHRDEHNKINARENAPKEDAPKIAAKSCVCGPSDQEPVRIVLPIVAVNVRGKGQQEFVRTHALLDPGSNKTFCSQALLDQLGLKGEKTTLSLETLKEGGYSEAFKVALEVTGTIGKKGKRKVIQMPIVYALASFPSLKNCVVTSADIEEWKHLKDINLPRVSDTEVTLLIGQDVPQALTPLEVRRGNDSEPYATRSALGWSVNGPVGKKSQQKNATCHFIQACVQPDVSLEAQVEQFWKVDTPQILAGSIPELSVNDKKVIGIWESSLTMDKGHYQMDIPFKVHPLEWPDNRVLAEKRLQSLGKRLAKDPEMHKRYEAGIQDLLAKGYAEHVPTNEVDASPGRTWYLPHHNVVNPNKPEKLRIVFDCAAEYEGTSLNKNVMQGPDMTNKLLGVLVRFREHKVAVMGDIEAMFHQVRISPHHRDVVRFLWWRDGNIANQSEVYRMAVHLFGGVWCPSCASYALRRTAEDNRDGFISEAVTTVLENFYADDCLKSVDTENEAIHLVEELCKLLALGGFRLTKWVSNSRKVVESIPPDERAKSTKAVYLDKGLLPVERALGVHWDTDSDVFGIRIKPKEKGCTRRGLLSVVSSVYDPLGFVSPYLLRAKMILQDECRKGKGWDDTLEPENLEKWMKWLHELPKLEDFSVPRCVISEGFGEPLKIQLHHFCDASTVAYGAVSYMRLINEEGHIHTSFLLGKSRLAPVKPMTVPRLELSAAVMAVRMDSMLRREMRLEVQETTFWTDSMIVLAYIKNTSRRFHTFVANRVSVIHDGSLPEQWRYIDTTSNPADDASRGLDAHQMLSQSRWKQGPEFLSKDETAWPVDPEVSPDLPDDDKEIKRNAKACAMIAVTVDAIDKLLKRFSCWHRLKKAVAWLMRFKRWLCNHRQLEPQASLQVDELQAAERAIISNLQGKYFREEVSALKTEGRISKKSAIQSLDPFLDGQGLLRIGGRLQAAPLTNDAKHPLIVPREHHVAELIVKLYHEKTAHSGKEYVLSRLRERFWIPRARPLINRVLRGCVTCKRISGKLCTQKMADLPKDRVTPGDPPFTFTGVDCFGPFLVKRGRSQEKRYGCLFTCLTTRAVHLEKLAQLDSDSFINALVRFAARRGMPRRIRSDNGTNFVGGERELRESIKKWNQSNKTKEYLLVNGIDWQFNPPAASHMGGIWERQIRTVRKAINSVLKDQVLDEERLDTLFCEVESIVNGRPITPVSDNPQDLEALTPNHLLLLRAGQPAAMGNFFKQDAYGRRWRHVQLLADQFWKRWVKEYLPTLQQRRKWTEPQRNLVAGDVVLVMDESTPRRNWPLGLILKTFPGKDGLVRIAEVKTRRNSFVRPVDKLCLLESQG